MKIPKTVNLRYTEGSSNKFYDISLNEKGNGWTVDFQYGRIGSSANIGSKTNKPVSYDEALKAFNKIVREKTGKGYIETGSGKTVIQTSFEEKDTGIRCQLLNEIEEKDLEKYLTDNNWCAQEKFDGVNRLLIHKDGKAIGGNRKGLTVAIPEEVEREVEILYYDLILCGEAISNYVWCFDLLQVKDHISKKPYKERYEIMVRLLGNLPTYLRIVKTAWTTEKKRALYEKLLIDGKEGIVFKDIRAPYTPGRPASGGTQVKFKFTQSASCIVTGINKTKRSIAFGLYENGQIIQAGNCTVYPNQEIPGLFDSRGRETVVEIKYLYAYKGGSLYQPVLLGIRNDVDPEECTISQLKYKKEETE